MSKVKLLLDVVLGMRSLADSLEAVADAMCDTHTVSEETEPQAPDLEPTQEVHDEPKLTLEDVRSVLSAKSANGHGAEIRELLQKYGHSKLSEIDPKDYPALLADAEVL
ncbi:MAG: rRNA biogenesis protein rrp5 [Clostridia bacterium]|nr:rRNA biogenesis protein rrp5 [Clostridia bacterium]